MDDVERAELYLRLRAERLLDTTHSAWKEVDTGAVQHVSAVAEALVALRVIDNTTFSSVLADLELAGWVRQRVLGEVARIRAVLTEALSPPRPPWPPEVLACPLVADADEGEVRICWLTRLGRGGSTSALVRITPTERPIGGDQTVGQLTARFGLDKLVLVDDRGGSYVLDWTGASRAQIEHGVDLLVELRPDPPSTVRELELRLNGRTVRADCRAAAPVEIGRRSHESMSPPHVYLANLLGLLPHGKPAPSSEHPVKGVPAAVAGALVDLGLVDRDDELVERATVYRPPEVNLFGSTGPSGPGGPGPAIMRPVTPHPIGRELDVQGVSVFLEGYVFSGRHLTVYLQLAEGPRRVTDGYAGPPWFGLIDDSGNTYALTVRSEDVRRIGVSLPSGLLHADSRALRFFVDTPFESAWIDLDVSSVPAPPAEVPT